ncbi:DUF4282 domain-containing protein [Devosia sp.]|uniref:DUF4282 domain-containing protein n=1 Tax=Devosia sp. TaxID=1871048 RepID=UPI002F1CD04F
MLAEDLKKIFLGPTLFRVDTILGQRLVPVLYATGLAALLLWAVTHLFATFGRNFGDGLWGLLEIAVFGLLGLLVLRAVCELLLVYFKAHETAVKTVSLSRVSGSLLDEVKDAISDIADEEAAEDDLPPAPTPASRSTALDVATRLPPRRPPVKRTARRTPPSETGH